MIARTVDKKVSLRLVGLDGNCFALLGAFAKAARHQGWSKQEIDGHGPNQEWPPGAPKHR